MTNLNGDGCLSDLYVIMLQPQAANQHAYTKEVMMFPNEVVKKYSIFLLQKN